MYLYGGCYYAELCNVDCHYAELLYAERCYDEHHYADCHYVDCRSAE
jgi:hypothetical protein